MSNCFAFVLILILAVSFLIMVKPAFSVTSATENTWLEKAPMPKARGYLEAAVVNEKIYAIGGSGPIGINEEYDPTTDTWTTKASMPNPEQSFAIAAYQGKIYCIGGMDSMGVNKVYDPSTGSWETKATMPTERYGLQANVVDGKIYCIGGVKPLGYNQGVEQLAVTEVYDPASDTWTTKASMPNAAVYVSSVVDKKIYVIGPGLTEIYNAETDIWSTGTPSPIGIAAGGANGVAAAAAATTGMAAPKRIYVYDGSSLQVYDPKNDSWTFGANSPISRQYLSIANVNDTLYFIGGFTYRPPGFYDDYATNEQYTPLGYGTIPQPTPSPQPETYLNVTVAVVSTVAVAVVAGLLVYFKKRKLRLDELVKKP